MKNVRLGGNLEKIYSRPIISFLVSMISGIALGSQFPSYALWLCLIIVVCAGFILYLIKQKKTALLSPIILFIAIGYISIQPWVVPKLPSNHIIHFVDSHKWKIVGTIDNNPIEIKNRQKFILQTETLWGNNTSFSVLGKLRVTVIGIGHKLSMGDRVSFTSRIRSIRSFNNPGGFDYKRYMEFKRIWGTAYVQREKISLLERPLENSFRLRIQAARDKISDLIETTKEGDQQKVLKALIIGDKKCIPQYLRETFNRAGVGHLLAISGLHIGIVATVAFILFSWMLSHSKTFLWNAWTKKGAAVLSLIPVFFYGLVAGMSPSTQRAVIMVTVFLMTFLFEREQDPMNTLAFAAMLILIVHPPALFSISFQLSFSAVFSILYGLSRIPIQQSRDKSLANQKIGYKVKEKLLSFILVSLFAILGTFPFVIF